MKVIDLKTWEEFESQLKQLEDERITNKYSAKYLYRGQKDHSLTLSTTLERNGKENLSLKEYHHLISIVKPQIESFTGTRWEIPSYPQGIDKWLKDNDTIIPNAFGWEEFQSTYSYMAYLRHYGFPSPFLDWSNSPYIAAYFAFRQPSLSDNDVAIYAYLETTSDIGLHSSSTSEPQIHTFGPFIRTDRRHFLQQSYYTICILHNDEWKYVSHESTFSRGDLKQDVLWKFRIPHSERMKVLKILDSYNINALSLCGDEESLMETMAFRGIHFRETDL